MMMKPKLTDEVIAALDYAKRTQGWNGRRGDVRRFQLDGCILYVVPYRRWAYRRKERASAASWQAQA